MQSLRRPRPSRSASIEFIALLSTCRCQCTRQNRCVVTVVSSPNYGRVLSGGGVACAREVGWVDSHANRAGVRFNRRLLYGVEPTSSHIRCYSVLTLPTVEALTRIETYLREHPTGFCYLCLAVLAEVESTDLVHAALKPRRNAPYAFNICDCAHCGEHTFCVAYGTSAL